MTRSALDVGRRASALRWLRTACLAGTVLAADAFGAAVVREPPRPAPGAAATTWSASDLALLRSLSVDALPRRAVDPSNAFQQDAGAAALGRTLFSEPRLSAGGRVSCVSCHQPERAYTDGRPLAIGLGAGRRNTPTLIGVAFGRFYDRDGRSDSLWSQAIGPLEAPNEMGGTRGQIARLIATDTRLRPAYERVFGPLDPAVAAALSAVPCGPAVEAAQANGPAAACWARLPPALQDRITRVLVNVAKALPPTRRPSAPRRRASTVSCARCGRAITRAPTAR